MIANPYSALATPPGPFVIVRVGATDGAAISAPLPAQLDSGADRTVVPVSILKELAVTSSGTIEVRGFAGATHDVVIFDVRLDIVGLATVKVEVAANADEPWLLLGRDVLNRYRVVLDGPNLKLEIA